MFNRVVRRLNMPFHAAMVLITAVAFLLLWEVFHFVNDYTAPQNFNERKAVLGICAQLTGGLSILTGAYFAWRQLQITQEKQITDRFAKAVDQLGSDRLEIRLGGIYALARIAKDSESDYLAVMDVLSAYLRENTMSKNKQVRDSFVSAYISCDSQPPIQKTQLTTEKPRLTIIPKPAADIQAILRVIGERRLSWPKRGGQGLNLTDVDIQGADLAGFYLEGANFSRANLNGVIFTSARLKGVDFTEAHLNRAKLNTAKLEGANFSNAELKQAVLTYACLEDAILDGANLEGGDLKGAKLDERQLERALLCNTTLENGSISNRDCAPKIKLSTSK